MKINLLSWLSTTHFHVKYPLLVNFIYNHEKPHEFCLFFFFFLPETDFKEFFFFLTSLENRTEEDIEISRVVHYTWCDAMKRINFIKNLHINYVSKIDVFVSENANFPSTHSLSSHEK